MNETTEQQYRIGDITLVIDLDVSRTHYRLRFPKDRLRNARLRQAIPGTRFDGAATAWLVPIAERDALDVWINDERGLVESPLPKTDKHPAPYERILHRLNDEHRRLAVAHATQAANGKMQIKTPYDETIVAHMGALPAVFRGTELGWFIDSLTDDEIQVHLVPILERLAHHASRSHSPEPVGASPQESARRRFEAIAAIRQGEPAPSDSRLPDGKTLWSLGGAEDTRLRECIIATEHYFYHVVEHPQARWPDSNAGVGVFVSRVPVTDGLLKDLTG